MIIMSLLKRTVISRSYLIGKLKPKMAYSSESKRRLKAVEELFEQLVSGNQATLVIKITLIESTKDSNKCQADALPSKALSYLKVRHETAGKSTFRIGIKGALGDGKSSLIETFGKRLTGEGPKVAVLAIDPSSVKTGGSLLGDRTRMVMFSHDPNAYIRPSPTAGTLGGVASASKLLRRSTNIWHPSVYPVSSLFDEGFDKVWSSMAEFKELMLLKNLFYLKRKQQNKAWIWRILRENILGAITKNQQFLKQI